MPISTSTPAAAWIVAVFVLIAVAALAVYTGQARRIMIEGGKVRAEKFDLPELLMTMVFAGFFGWIVLNSMERHKTEPAVKIESVLPNSLIFVIFTVGIAGFLRFRGLSLNELFGFGRVPPFKVAGWAIVLLCAAFPLAGIANALTMLASPEKLEPQPLVELFSKVAGHHDVAAMAKILVSAVIIQPATEEFLFRGFFYGVWKRYLGGVRAGLLASLLFAAFHGSLAAFSGLLLLAICLNIAYERTGSLFVPIGMHALFNFTSLLVIYFGAQVAPAS